MWWHLPSVMGLQMPAETVPVYPYAGQLKLQEMNPTLCVGNDGTDTKGHF